MLSNISDVSIFFDNTETLLPPSSALSSWLSLSLAAPTYKDNCSVWTEYLATLESNTTLVLPYYCEPPYYALWEEIVIATILTSMCLMTMVGNLLVILSVLLVKKLRSASNFLIVSLACSDFLVSLLPMPLATGITIKNYSPYPEWLCSVFLLSDVLLCTSSIINLAFISIDRYLMITRPMTYTPRRDIKFMACLIAGAWSISAIITFLPLVVGWVEPFQEGKCDYSSDLGYQIYATCGAFYFPLFVMLLVYGKIFSLVRLKAKADQHHRPRIVSADDDDDENDENEEFEMNENFTPTEGSEKKVFIDGEGGGGGGGLNGQAHSHHAGRRPSERNVGRRRLENVNHKHDKHRQKQEKERRRSLMKSKNKSKNDSKAIQTLGVIMGCFTICWLPFFIVQLMTPLVRVAGQSEAIQVPLWLFQIFLWLGYANSTLNPVIYAKFNKEFRRPFKEILLCHCTSINKRLRCASFTQQYALPKKRRHNTPPPLPPPLSA